ncbi:MAG: NapC/NirT family cytochrome c [Vicinamibacterales bacterium]
MGTTYTAQFCGQVCHEVMRPEFTAYQDGPHSRVTCVQCHIGPGASWFARSKVSGMRQVIAVARSSYSRPIASPVQNLRPAREVCEQCHWPEKFHGALVRRVAEYSTTRRTASRHCCR